MARRQSTNIFVDTSFVVALVNERDQAHARALELSERYQDAQLVLTDAVILEIGNSLSRRFRDEAIALIDRFYGSADVMVVPLSRVTLQRAINLYKSYRDKTWGLVDCVSFVVMRDLGITDALTSDRDFRQAGFNPMMLD